MDVSVEVQEGMSLASALREFVTSHVMDSEAIREKYSYPAVPSHLEESFHKEMGGHILQHMIGVLFLLDKARTAKLLPHCTCLFNPGTFKVTCLYVCKGGRDKAGLRVCA